MSRNAKMFVSLALAHVVVDCYGGVWPIFKYLAKLDLAWAGVIATVTLFIGAGLQPIFGLWADHGHQRRFIVWGTGLTALGIVAGGIEMIADWLGQVGYYILLAIMMLAVRVGQALYHPAGASMAGNVHDARRSTFLSLFIAAGMFGYAFSQWLFARTYQWLDGHTYLMLLPAVAIVILAGLWCDPEHATPRRAVAYRQAVRTLWTMRHDLTALFLIQTIVSAVMLGVLFIMPEFLEHRGYPTWLIEGWGTALWILGAVALMVPAGHLADRIGRRTLLIVVTFLGAVLFYVAVLVPPLPVALYCLILFAAGGCIATTNPLGVALGQQLAPHHASLISGVLLGLAWACSAFAQTMVGAMAASETFGIVGALCVLGVFMVAAMPIAMYIPAEKPRPGVEAPTELEGDLVVPLSVPVDEQ